MKVIYLWNSLDVPKPKTWVEFNPKRAAYVEDASISEFNLKTKHSYYNVGMRKKMYFVLTEATFFTLSYIDRIEGDTYCMRSLVNIKEETQRDYEVVIVTSEAEYNALLANYPNKVEFDDVIVTEMKTTDKTVELLYFPKEVIDVIETV